MIWLFIAYPVLVHSAVVSGWWQLEFAAIVVLAIIAMANALASKRLWAWTALAAIGVVAWWIAHGGLGISFLYLPSVLLPGMMLILFGRSLRKGATPLVTLVATQMRDGNMTPELIVYGRQMTRFWCGVFAFIALTSIGLAVFAPPLWWSLFTNFISYALLATLFVGEYFYRQRHFGDEHELHWKQFTKRMFEIDFRNL